MGRGSKRHRTDRYREQKKRESRGAAGYTRKSFAEYIEAGKGRTANEAANYIKYTPKGRLTVDREAVKQGAFNFVKESQQFPEYPREHVVKTWQGTHGRTLSPKYAEERINQEYAIKARGILI